MPEKHGSFGLFCYSNFLFQLWANPYLMQHNTRGHPLAMVCVTAPEDAVLLTQWESHLRPLEQAGLISFWSSLHLMAGEQRAQEQERHLNQAHLILLLLSADFFTSPDCLTMMERALERSHAGSARIIPLLLRPVAWQESPLAELALWPSNGVPLTQWTNQDAAWHACVQDLRRLLGRRVAQAPPAEGIHQQADPDWERMLRRLRRSYNELLDQSLHGIAWVELGLSTQPDLVSNVTNLLFRLSQGDERLLAPGTSILDAYNEAEGELLILGAPGAGKSTLLLDLAQQLVGQALTDPGHRLPVIFRLSSWALGRPALTDWMEEQLSHIYDVPRSLSERWVKQGRLLPLLDGLDEMEEAARPACIDAINRYHRIHLAPLVVCSRQAEYEAFSTGERLALQSAVIVQPLSKEHVEEAVQAAGASFAGMRTALSKQPVLRELAATPLMLSVLLLTYRDSSPEITQQGMDMEQQVWTDYARRMVAEKGDDIRYPLQCTHAWLAFLAQQLREHQQTVFSAEYLDARWLPDSQQHIFIVLTRFLPSLVIGACVSLLIRLFILPSFDIVTFLQMGVLGGFVGGSFREQIVSLSNRLSKRKWAHLRNATLLGVLLAASYGLVRLQEIDGLMYSLSDWLHDECIFGVVGLLSGWAFQVSVDRHSGQQTPVASTHHRRGRLMAWMNRRGPLRHWRAAALLGGGIGLSEGLSDGLPYVLRGYLGNGLSFGLSTALIFGLSFGLSVILIDLILTASLHTHRFAERISWRWHALFRGDHIRAMVVVTAMVFLLFALIYGFAAWFVLGPIGELSSIVLNVGPNGRLSIVLNERLSYGHIDALSYGFGAGLNTGLSVGVSIGLAYWLLLGLYQGIQQEHLDDQHRFRFNQGIHHSLRNGLLASLISTVIIGTMNALDTGLTFGLSYGLSVVQIVLVAGLVVMWALCGGITILRHYVIRWLLARSRTFPFRAQAFLDDATARILLRRVGGGYSFIHRRLQDYFADAAMPPPEK